MSKIIDTVDQTLCKGGRVNPDYKIFLSKPTKNTKGKESG